MTSKIPLSILSMYADFYSVYKFEDFFLGVGIKLSSCVTYNYKKQ